MMGTCKETGTGDNKFIPASFDIFGVILGTVRYFSLQTGQDITIHWKWYGTPTDDGIPIMSILKPWAQEHYFLVRTRERESTYASDVIRGQGPLQHSNTYREKLLQLRNLF